MPKLKTHKGISKVLKLRPGGTIGIGCAGNNHKTGKKNAKHNRNIRKGSTLSKTDERRIKSLVTYR